MRLFGMGLLSLNLIPNMQDSSEINDYLQINFI